VISLNSFHSRLFHVNKANFDRHCLDLFRWQAERNEVYRNYLEKLSIQPEGIHSLDAIPFLPIQFFKKFSVTSGRFHPEKVFESSGTSGASTSKHHIKSLSFYHKISTAIFNQFYGDLDKYHILGLLPSYLERSNASLVHMVQHFIDRSDSSYSGFFLDHVDALSRRLDQLRHTDRKVLLIGVTFALLDLPFLPGMENLQLMIMETGGMKGRGKELTRQEVHQVLIKKFKVEKIHSEYGMTELHSQAYSRKNGWFQTPEWMKVMIRDIHDPFSYMPDHRTGGINIIDLANIDTCAFIETEDLGISNAKGDFQVLGRMDNTDVRGCNLMLH